MATLTQSPIPAPRFQQHVGFDNLPVGEATKNNPSSFTLQARHRGYQSSRRSRTFMIGVDEHAYSDYALVWLLNNMVDDGDEVICVRVVESPFRPGEKNYQEEAKRLLQAIQAKNELNKAISIILEYSVGKLHDTFQQLVGLPLWLGTALDVWVADASASWVTARDLQPVDARGWYQRTVARGLSRAGEYAELILQILPSVQPDSGRGGSAGRQAAKEEGEALARPVAAELRGHACIQ